MKESLVDDSGDPENIVAGDRGRSGGRADLIQKRYGITECAVTDRGDGGKCIRLDRDILLRCDKGKTLDDAFVADAAEVVALAAGEDRGRDTVRLGRCQKEDGMGRRFFQRLEKSVKSTGREHMHLVDDIHFIFCFCRHKHDFVTDPADIIYTVVTGGVHLDNIEKRAVNDAFTDLAFVTGVAVNRVLAVDRTGEDLGDRCLTCSSCSAEEIGMADLPQDNGLA